MFCGYIAQDVTKKQNIKELIVKNAITSLVLYTALVGLYLTPTPIQPMLAIYKNKKFAIGSVVITVEISYC